MNLEESLAASKIAQARRAGYSKECAINQAARYVKSQGFSAKHAKQVAMKMAELVR